MGMRQKTSPRHHENEVSFWTAGASQIYLWRKGRNIYFLKLTLTDEVLIIDLIFI